MHFKFSKEGKYFSNDITWLMPSCATFWQSEKLFSGGYNPLKSKKITLLAEKHVFNKKQKDLPFCLNHFRKFWVTEVAKVTKWHQMKIMSKSDEAIFTQYGTHKTKKSVF